MVNAKYYRRIYGWLLDELVALLFGIACVFLIFYFDSAFSLFFAVAISVFVDYFFYVFITSIVMYLTKGSSIGMLIERIRTVDLQSSRLTYRACFLKCFLNGIIVVTIVNAFFMIFVHTERSIFDRLTNTTAVERHH
ncbi:MAG: RDD family protein [Bacillales bacterium]|nr:RDD family protein [Mollicutes bacterium]MCI7213238.1 RDD family protein [Bacillales bacterium]MDY3904437.1 RDD family protein [Candidatus Enteromonas sp.]MCI7058430.1 RDD family protein [Mollicutes bacterium]MDD7715334.1 RDD family protein [Mollicutes bacterium]